MKALPDTAPVAARLGFVHVSVGPVGDAFGAFMWSCASGGPKSISPLMDYEGAVDRARAYVAADPGNRILDLPDGLGEVNGRGLIHVYRQTGDQLEVLHESASGNSFGPLRRYDAKERKRALLFAIDMLATYSNSSGASRLGEVQV